ncbi:hypothetical protein HYH03_010476 [Edaphochlamys debaryana]|uniref:Exonuclease domain-containing protein n=1 Tax=Edaphochlamys debaryana TaxID=47281 RepID=A0A835XVK6_9CHLO|nr:hypothetical protein HYH03_010476 [Edaphochlamys debaryana]|eukprot:KAG2491028.1 hypothetical protein HYH03_010476 [Edaphochlamys debaryana]
MKGGKGAAQAGNRKQASQQAAESESDIEDGELPGEQLQDYAAPPSPPHKQRKLAPGDVRTGSPQGNLERAQGGGKAAQDSPAAKRKKGPGGKQGHGQGQDEGANGSGPSVAASRAALKARLEGLMAPDAGAGGSGGAAGGGSSAGHSRPAAGGQGGGKYVADVYKDARPSVEIKGPGGRGVSGAGGNPQAQVRLADVQALAAWALSPGSSALVEAPRWAFVKNKPLVRGVVLVLASGLSASMLADKAHLLPFLCGLKARCGAATVLTTPQTRPAQSTAELLTTKLAPRAAKRKRQPGEPEGEGEGAGAGTDGRDGGSKGKAGGAKAKGGGRGAAHESAPPAPGLPPGPFPPSHYVASLEELRAHNYPLPLLEEAQGGEGAAGGARKEEQGAGADGGGGGDGEGGGRLVCPPGFVATKPSGDPSASERMVALDCEMCITEAGFELTRLTLVAGPGWGPGTQAARDAEALRESWAQRFGPPVPAPTASPPAAGDNKTGPVAGGGKAAGSSGSGSAGGDASAPVSGSSASGFPVGCVLLDALVLPRRPITDYNTRYSGITPAMLQGCKVRLEDAQSALLALLPAEALLVGHALENDLRALAACHGRLLDTALLFPHPKGPPFKSALKILARRYLRRSIQEGSHDSAVDARTALDLVLLKIKNGPTYGAGGSGPHAQAPKLADVLSAQCGTRCCLVDRHDVLGRYVTGSTAAVPVASDDDAVGTAGRQAGSGTYGFVWTQLTELSTFLFRRARHHARAALERELAELDAQAAAEQGADEAGGAVQPKAHGGTSAAANGQPAGARSSTPHSSQPSASPGSGSGPDYSDAALDAVLRSYDGRLQALWGALPERWMLVVATGAGDTAEYDRRYEQRCKRCAADSGLPAWSQAEETALHEFGALQVQGLAFAAMKGDGREAG